MRPPVRLGFAVAVVLVAVALPSPLYAADSPTHIVVPGRAGVPVMYYGRDISWAVIEGDWGLDRPGEDNITIIPAPRPWPPAGRGPNKDPYYRPGAAYPVPQPAPIKHFYPSTGNLPAYGRDEVEPPADRVLPKPAESYHREWGAESAATPVTIPPAYEAPPMLLNSEVPPVRPPPRSPTRRTPVTVPPQP
jgi:hypothetical protein